jgi:hypothetical protein
MNTNEHSSKSPFVKLEEQVTLASSSERVVKTAQVGRVIGFGCHSSEQEAHEALTKFAKQARKNPSSAGPDFEKKVRGHVAKLEKAILSQQKKRTAKGAKGSKGS